LQQCKGRYEIIFRFMFNGKIEPEHSRHKKILDYFIKFMNENLTCGADNLMLLSREASNDTTDVRLIRQQNCEVVSSGQPSPFLKCFKDGKQAMAMELSNETLQVNFSGSRKFVIHKPRSLTRAIILVIDSKRQGQASIYISKRLLLTFFAGIRL
jgi:hypothetical protein